MSQFKSYYAICIAILVICSPRIILSDISDNKRLSFGGSISPIYSMHVADMLPPKPMSICCQKFTKGDGLGWDFSFFAHYIINNQQSLQGSIGYRDISATMLSNQRLIVNQRLDTGFVRSTLTTDLSLLYLELVHNFSPIRRMELSIGFNLGINASKNYSFNEELISDSLTFDNSTRLRNVSFGALTGINPRYFGGVIGLAYSIPFFSTNLFVKPTLQYTYGFRPLQYGTNWYAHTMLFGLNWEYKPFGEIERPVNIENIPSPNIPNEQSIITVLSKKKKVTSIYQYLYEYPVLHDITVNIIRDCHSQYLVSDNCSEDNGSCLYESILDTLSRRSRENPQELISIGYISKSKIDSVMIQLCLQAHSIDISKIEYVSYSSYPFTSNVGYTILNNKLTTPFLVKKQDTVISKASLSFMCIGNTKDSILWGIYDSEIDSVIIKGKALANHEITVSALPLGFKKGNIRCIIKHDGKSDLIQHNVYIDDSSSTIQDTLPVETGVLFAFDSDSLIEKYENQLLKFRSKLNRSDSLIIEAFTDLSGDFDYNRDLAARRANRVFALFTGIHTEIILSPLKKRNAGLMEHQRAYNRIVTITRKNAIKR
jgi:hypothetical protein